VLGELGGLEGGVGGPCGLLDQGRVAEGDAADRL
jgi:hypothetical protein